MVHEVKKIVRLKNPGLAYHESKLLVSRIQVHRNLLSILEKYRLGYQIKVHFLLYSFMNLGP